MGKIIKTEHGLVENFAVEEEESLVRVVANLPQSLHDGAKVRIRDGFGSMNNYINALIRDDLKSLEAERAVEQCGDDTGSLNAVSFVLRVEFYGGRWHVRVESARPFRHLGGLKDV